MAATPALLPMPSPNPGHGLKCGCGIGQGGWLTEYGEEAGLGMSASYSPEGEHKMELFGKNK